MAMEKLHSSQKLRSLLTDGRLQQWDGNHQEPSGQSEEHEVKPGCSNDKHQVNGGEA
jgi:hypothetical protein